MRDVSKRKDLLYVDLANPEVRLNLQHRCVSKTDLKSPGVNFYFVTFDLL